MCYYYFYKYVCAHEQTVFSYHCPRTALERRECGLVEYLAGPILIEELCSECDAKAESLSATAGTTGSKSKTKTPAKKVERRKA
jgi:hypothetical protein